MATPRVDMHVHAGVLGHDDPSAGGMSAAMRSSTAFRIFLLYNRLDPATVTDSVLRERLLAVIQQSRLDRVVVLALDQVHDTHGKPQPQRTTLWVSNEWVRELADEYQSRLPPQEKGKCGILLGASVHPFDPDFRNRVRQVVDWGAVLLKWLPSAQQFSLADPRVGDALQFLATAKAGAPLPVLLHVGSEYAIETSDERTRSYDFLSWGGWDRFWNALRPAAKRWRAPDLKGIETNLTRGLDAGAVVIFAHCGLPYFAPSWLERFAEHSDLKAVRSWLGRYPADGSRKGRCYADVSALITPFRYGYFPDVRKLPRESLLVGSDFPVPVFELSADLKENARDFKAIMAGDLGRIVIPQGNLLDVNWRELEHAFPGHPMFENTAKMFA